METEAFDDCLKTDKQRKKALELRIKSKAQLYFSRLPDYKKMELIFDCTRKQIFKNNPALLKNFMAMSMYSAENNEILLNFIIEKHANNSNQPTFRYQNL